MKIRLFDDFLNRTKKDELIYTTIKSVNSEVFVNALTGKAFSFICTYINS